MRNVGLKRKKLAVPCSADCTVAFLTMKSDIIQTVLDTGQGFDGFLDVLPHLLHLGSSKHTTELLSRCRLLTGGSLSGNANSWVCYHLGCKQQCMVLRGFGLQRLAANTRFPPVPSRGPQNRSKHGIVQLNASGAATGKSRLFHGRGGLRPTQIWQGPRRGHGQPFRFLGLAFVDEEPEG